MKVLVILIKRIWVPYFPSFAEQDFYEEGINRLSQIATWSQINAWSMKWLKQIIALATISYFTVDEDVVANRLSLQSETTNRIFQVE